MISLAALADLHGRYADAAADPVGPVTVGDVVLGDDAPVVMGVVNLSRDSSYRESVAPTTADAVRMARVQAAQGAGIVDLGAESSFDGAAVVGAADQVAALVPVVEAVADEVVVSVETYEPEVVAACLAAGARVLNLTGRRHEEEMLELAARHDAAVVMCFGETDNVRAIADVDLAADPVPPLLDHFGPRLERARALGVERLVVDPGIGFDYGNLRDPAVRARHQSRMLLHGFRLRALGVPLCNALPSAFDLFLDEVRTAEAFFGVLASLGGTHLFRTHEVPRVRAALAAMAALDVT